MNDSFPDGYVSITVQPPPQDTDVYVMWGTLQESHGFGVAKNAHGKWFIRHLASPLTNNRECAIPKAWHPESSKQITNKP